MGLSLTQSSRSACSLTTPSLKTLEMLFTIISSASELSYNIHRHYEQTSSPETVFTCLGRKSIMELSPLKCPSLRGYSTRLIVKDFFMYEVLKRRYMNIQHKYFLTINSIALLVVRIYT